VSTESNHYNDVSIYRQGWTDATESVITIWRNINELAPGRTEAFEEFDKFISMCELRLMGASETDIKDLKGLYDGN
jgi:hypothetical protein